MTMNRPKVRYLTALMETCLSRSVISVSSGSGAHPQQLVLLAEPEAGVGVEEVEQQRQVSVRVRVRVRRHGQRARAAQQLVRQRARLLAGTPRAETVAHCTRKQTVLIDNFFLK